MTKRGSSTVTYSSYNLPTVINSGSNSSSLYYGAFRNRYKQVAVASGTTETTIYVGGLFERVTLPSGVVEYRHYIPGANGVAALHTRRTSGINDTYYLHPDHLGSPEVISNASGGAAIRLSFGAYGERRDGSDWQGPPSAADLTTIANITRRGFTGHEHLDSVGLIHMRGRVYDPAIGKFLSRDPVVDGVFASQGINGFSYVQNNPLSLFDPTGHCADHGERRDEAVQQGDCIFVIAPRFVYNPRAGTEISIDRLEAMRRGSGPGSHRPEVQRGQRLRDVPVPILGIGAFGVTGGAIGLGLGTALGLEMITIGAAEATNIILIAALGHDLGAGIVVGTMAGVSVGITAGLVFAVGYGAGTLMYNAFEPGITLLVDRTFE